MPPRQLPPFIFFDAGHTLLDPVRSPSEVYAETFTRHGVACDAARVGPVFRAVWQRLHTEGVEHGDGRDRYGRHPKGERGWWGELVRGILRELGDESPWEECLQECWVWFRDSRNWQLFPEVPEVIATLSSRGHRLGIISNWDSYLGDLLVGLAIAGDFHPVIISAVEGVEKPSQAIFELALSRAGVAPTEALHIGDSMTDDYRGARRAGMAALLVDREDQFPEHEDRIRTLASLL